MLRSIITFGSQFRYLVIIVAAALVVFGITQAKQVPVDVLPEFSPPYVEIQTEALGLSAKEVEQMITVPMEQDLLSGVAWMDTIRSESLPGLSSIVVFFEPGTDLMAARQMVAERMTQAVALPHVSKPPIMLQPLSSSSRIIIVGLSSKTLSPIQTSVLARWTIGPRLMGVPGVSNVAIWGQRDRQLQVQVSPERLQAQDVSLQKVLETTGNALWVSSLSFLEASTPGTGGFIDTPQQRLGIWHVSPISSAHELARVPIEGSTALLGDVATVVEDHQPLIGDAMSKDATTLFLVIEKLPAANTLEVTRKVEEALAAMAPGLTGVEINTQLFRPASFIESAINNIGRSLLVGLVLMVLLLLLVFRSWQIALIAAITVPMSLVAAAAVLYWRGATINMMVLCGLLVGVALIIDDVVHDLAHIQHRLRQHLSDNVPHSPQQTITVIVDTLVETRGALLFASLITILAIIPVLWIPGILGSLLEPMVQSYIVAVLVSLVGALFTTTALSVILLAAGVPLNQNGPSESALTRRLQLSYGRMVEPLLRSPRVSYVFVAGMGMIALLGLPLIGSRVSTQTLLPNFRETDLMIRLEGGPGTSQPAMLRLVSQASHEIEGMPGVSSVGTNIGRAVFGDQKVSINSAQMWVRLDPAANFDTAVAQIREVINGYPGITGSVQTYLNEKSQSGIANLEAPVYVRVFGENLDTLKSQAQSVQKVVAGVAGVSDATVSLPAEEATVEIEVNLEAAQKYGIKPGDVRRTAAIMISGLVVGSLFEEQKVFDVVVWSTPEVRNSIEQVRELRLDTPDGGYVRLGEVADIRIAASPTVIRRESISPYLDITFGIQGRSSAAVISDIKAAIAAAQFPLEYHAEVLGSYDSQQENLLRTLLAALIIGLGTLLLLQASFNGWRMAIIVFLLLPLSVSGGVLAATIIGGRTVSLSTLLGLFLVFGVAARDGVRLIGNLQRLRQQEGVVFSPALALQLVREQFVPIFASTLSIAVFMLPFLVLGNIAGLEMVYPMVPVILGGLLSALVLNLFVVPSLYMRFGGARATAGSKVTPPIVAMPAN